MKVKTKLALLCSTLLSALLSGCGGLGNGVLPVSAVIQPSGGVEGAATTKAFTCLNSGLTLLIDFSDGSRGDFTSRATYTSSNPAVAQVSNLDIPVPEQANSFYSRGTVVAVAPGTTTITARYLSFTRSIDVTVSEIQNFRVTSTSGNLAVGSRLDFSVTADLDGVTTSIDPVVLWSFVTPNSTVATIDSAAGTVTGVAVGSGLTARARIPACGLTADVPVTVATLQSLALTREFGAVDTLIVGTSERLIATGTLDNGMTQDLTAQVSYVSSVPASLSLFAGGVPNLAFALAAATSPVQVTATFDSTQDVVSPSIGIQPVTDSLNTISITPATTAVNAGQSTQFSAIGSYASGATQDITRHVGWSSSNNAFAVVQSSGTSSINALAGLATTASTASGNSVTLTAAGTSAAAQAISATATLTIN